MRRPLVWVIATGVAAGALVTAAALQAQKTEAPQPAAQIFFGGEGSWLGVELSDVTADKVRQLKLPGEYGVIVDTVEANSPASKAGLESNDVIVGYNGERAESVAQFRRLIRETPAGRTVSVSVIRGGRTLALTATLGSSQGAVAGALGAMRPFAPGSFPRFSVPGNVFNLAFGYPRLGVEVDDLTPQLAQYFGVTQGKGVLVRSVEAGSAAEKAGLKAGDCITRVGSTEVNNASDLRKALRQAVGKSTAQVSVAITIVRNRRERTVKAEIEPARPFRFDYTADFANLERQAAELGRLRSELRRQATAIASQAPRSEAIQQEMRALSQQLRQHSAEMQRSAAQAARLQNIREQIEQYRRQIEQYRRAIHLYEQLHRELERAHASSVV